MTKASVIKVVAGQHVADKIAALKLTMVAPSKYIPDCFDSESLCRFQRQMSAEGYLEAQIIKSSYGYSVSYASGLQNWAMLLRSRDSADKSYERALKFAIEWQAEDSNRRYVTITERPY